jgi:pimeloyl-ACP methyl ester carboxylesterase
MKIRLSVIFLIMFIASAAVADNFKTKSKDGTEIAYSVYGKGETAIVFIHGWSCDQTYWKNQINTFAQNYTVVTIDLAGHGNSGLTRKNYTMDFFGEDVASVVNNLNLNKVILAAHSMGGSVAVYAANKLKGKVLGIIGVDTFQSLGEEFPAEQREAFLKPFKENFPATAKWFVGSMFPKTADSLLVKSISEDMSSAPADVALSAMENMFADNGTEQLKQLEVPIISINCDIWPIGLENNRKLVKSFEIKMMNGYGHFLMLEDSEKFNKLLAEAITEICN